MLRKIIFLATAVSMLLILTGCGLDKKIGESITEGILENAGSGDEKVDVNLDGGDFSITTDEGEMNFDEEGGYTFKGEDGEAMTVSEDNEWPEGMAADLLPKLNKGKITYSMNLNNGCMMTIGEIELDDFNKYVEKVKEEGFTEDSSESKSDDFYAYGAYSDEQTYIYIYYTESEKVLSLTLNIEEKSADE